MKLPTLFQSFMIKTVIVVRLIFFFLAQSEFNIMCKFYRFALNINTKCLRFNCLTNCIGTSGVECFNYHWGSPSMNWLLTPHQD